MRSTMAPCSITSIERSLKMALASCTDVRMFFISRSHCAAVDSRCVRRRIWPVSKPYATRGSTR